MKKASIIFKIFISVFLLSASYGQSQGKYYYAFDEKIFLEEVSDKVVLSFDKNYLSEIQTNLKKNSQIRHMELQIHNNLYILTTEKTDTKTLKENLLKQKGIKSIHPMYITVDGLEMSFTNEIVMQFKENVSQQDIEKIHQKYRVEVKEITELYYVFSVPIDFDPLEVANAYQTSGLVNFSTPDFFCKD